MQDPFLATLAASFVNAASTLAVFPLIDTMGRKKLLLSGTIGMAISGILLCYALSRYARLRNATHPQGFRFRHGSR